MGKILKLKRQITIDVPRQFVQYVRVRHFDCQETIIHKHRDDLNNTCQERSISDVELKLEKHSHLQSN